MYEVTIAIPIYNVEPYITKSLESALAQTFGNIEFLVIDDKGTDGSMDIVRHLQQEHPRGKDMRIVDNIVNKGISETRNVALREASGKYFFFLDSDDYLAPSCIETLYNAIVKENVELVIGSSLRISVDGKMLESVILPDIVVHKPNELVSLRFGSLHSYLRGYCWNILYSLSFLRQTGVVFKNYRICSDTVFSLDFLPLVSSFVLSSVVTYYYVIRPDSLTLFTARNTIPLKEIREQISIREYAKKKMQELKGKPYYKNMVVHVMRYCYHGAFSIMRKKKLIVPSVSSSDIDHLLSFPVSLKDVIVTNGYRCEFLLYYLNSCLPIKIKMMLVAFMSKLYYRRR